MTTQERDEAGRTELRNATNLGWVVEAGTRRDGCDAGERHQRYTLEDAEILADEIRAAHADDDQHYVVVRRETSDDLARGVGWYDT